MGAFVANLGEQLAIPLQLQTNRPALYLSDQEKKTPLVEPPYFVVNGGTKTDYTAKAWAGYAAVVEHFRGRVPFVQIGERHHRHEPLAGAVNMIGKTTPRQLFQLIYHGLGGLGPTTFLQHVHAALGKFYVCILGGREPKWWADYP
jgi:ADP-heptose:LPS heptosyltransferase